jgi:uncharacterized protein (DUF433 family)
MSENYLIFVSPDEIRLKGHRIWLEHIVAYFEQNKTDEEILAELPTLTADEVAGVCAYYDTHRAEVNDYVACSDAALVAEYERSRQQTPAPVVARIRKLVKTLHEQGRQQALWEIAESSQT